MFYLFQSIVFNILSSTERAISDIAPRALRLALSISVNAYSSYVVWPNKETDCANSKTLDSLYKLRPTPDDSTR